MLLKSFIMQSSYCLWDPTSGRVFNTFHVLFIEHLDTAPMKYLPGETVHDNTPATWNTLSDVHAEPSSGISTLYRPPPALPSPINPDPDPTQDVSCLPSPLTPLPSAPPLTPLR